jgi:hypothetical protein
VRQLQVAMYGIIPLMMMTASYIIINTIIPENVQEMKGGVIMITVLVAGSGDDEFDIHYERWKDIYQPVAEHKYLHYHE